MPFARSRSRSLTLALPPEQYASLERLARGYGLDLAGLFQQVAAGMGKAPGFVAGHLLRHLPGRPLPGPDARG